MSFQMIDVGEKTITRRRALARGVFRARAETIDRIWRGDLPKGEALKLAEMAGIMAAKRTPDLLPLCHPLMLDSVRVYFEKRSSLTEIEAYCEVICHGKTGVEMEALTGVQAALLCVYDLAKNIDPELEMTQTILLEKEGGKTGHWVHPDARVTQVCSDQRLFQGLTAGVLTISDRCSRGESEDLTGPQLRKAIEEQGARVAMHGIVPDEVSSIQNRLREWVDRESLDFIITTGGTGVSKRDVTPEALRNFWDRELPGFGEYFRKLGSSHTPMAWLSRAEAGIRANTIIFVLPGSRGAVTDGMQIIQELLPHALHVLRGGKH